MLDGDTVQEHECRHGPVPSLIYLRRPRDELGDTRAAAEFISNSCRLNVSTENSVILLHLYNINIRYYVP